MNWRSDLPKLPRGWYWLRYDARTHLVLLRCVYGLWCWVAREMAALDDPLVLDAFHRGLRQGVADGVRGECTIVGGYSDLPTSPDDNTMKRVFYFDVVMAPPATGARRWVDFDRGSRRLVST